MEEGEGDKANTPPPPPNTTGDDGGGGDISFGLPDEVLRVLPQDPFAQLDVARRITSIALSTRVSALESEAAELRAHLQDRDALVESLRSRIESLDAALAEAGDKLAAADAQKEALLKENSTLSNAVKKLNRDVSKLEVFKKTLMRSLQDDEDASGGGAEQQSAASDAPTNAGFSSTQSLDDDSAQPSSAYSSMRSQTSEPVASSAEDHQFDGARLRISHGLLSASQTSTPRFTPPGSPPTLSASASPTKTSKPTSPRRHSVSFATSRGMFDMSSFPHGSRDSISSYDGSSQTARTRVDGKEFFRQVRSRLSYEQFGAFLSNVKQLNSHKQTKEETLRKADEIFGAENKDLYTIFEGLLSRNYP